HGIELRCVAESPHVSAHEPKPRSLAETTPCLVEHRAREIQPDHVEPAPAELGGVASITTRHVEDPRTPRQAEAPKQKIHLAPGLPGRLLVAQLGNIVTVEEAREPLRSPCHGAHARGLRLTSVSGRMGSVVISTPSGFTASATALAMAAGAPMVPPSPMPLCPPGVSGDGVSRWPRVNDGRSPAVGSA